MRAWKQLKSLNMPEVSKLVDALCLLREAGMTKEEVIATSKRLGTRIKEKTYQHPIPRNLKDVGQ